MHNLLRYYYRNRIKVWGIILGIIFILVVIQLFNSFAKQKKIEENSKEETTFNDVVSYDDESESIISEGTVSKKYRNDFGELINQFYTYCINHEPEKAYNLLSNDMKKMTYGTESLFENLYYKEKFEGDKQFSFQSWSQNDDRYVYKVKIFDNMLSTGKSSNQEYIEDYVTIVSEGGLYKLNVDSYIGNRQIYKKNSNELLEISVNMADIYINNEIYTISVKNNTNNRIMIDTRKKSKTTYIVDDNESKFEAILYENKENELILNPQESKTIKIKFNDAYRDNIQIKEMNFEDIVNYDEYLVNQNVERKSLKVEL